MFYKFAQFLAGIYIFAFHRVKVCGKDNIPAEGGAILCANHASAMDPVLLGVCIKRQVHFIAKKELYGNKLFSAVLRWLGAIKVDRAVTDMTAYREALNLLKAGGLIGIFAQGHRLKDLDARGAKSGVALFALKSRVKVIPVAIKSDYKRFGRVSITCGEPVSLECPPAQRKLDAKTLAEATEKIMLRVNELLEAR
ncbi:MAG: 1-acyl-sn-glycerol-3-phosphate acyltransferase [Clostridiales bacterium]|jgi:1-acyl-sn-glycerol-3-phosphate acyltransferase|nr:1-acyl-sn-glycerol-3-phosphate acyltransferase [Clostridiales bacterium]